MAPPTAPHVHGVNRRGLWPAPAATPQPGAGARPSAAAGTVRPGTGTQGRCRAVLCHRLADVAVGEATFCAPAHVRLFSPCVEMLFPDFPRYRLKK